MFEMKPKNTKFKIGEKTFLVFLKGNQKAKSIKINDFI